MLRTTLANLRAHWSRLVAVGVAVMLAVAFVSATLMLSASFQATLRSAFAADLAGADVVATLSNDSGADDAAGSDAGSADTGSAGADGTAATATFTAAQADRVRALPEIDEAALVRTATLPARIGDQTEYLQAAMDLPAGLRAHPLTDGAWAASADELTMDAAAANRLGLAIGDTVTVTTPTLPATSGADATDGSADADDVSDAPAGGSPAAPGAMTSGGTAFTIVGLTEANTSPLAAQLPGVTLTEAGLARAVGADAASLDSLAPAGTIIASTASGVTETDAVQSVGDVLGAQATVRGVDQYVTDQVKTLTGDTDALTGMLLVFAVIALLVAVLVIANTFSVIVAQRTRELALLRCLGASRGQVRRSVLLEAVVMSVVASAAGVGLAAALMSGVVALSRSGDTGLLDQLAVPPSAVITGMLAGVLVTVLAAWRPAMAATRVAPLAALRPAEDAGVRSRGGRVRLGVGVALLALGVVLQLWGLRVARADVGLDSAQAALANGLTLGVTGSVLVIVGVLVLAVFIVPPLVRAIGALVAWTGVPARMAVLNATRDPRRTAATASALLIGVTLVTTVFTGASVARATLTDAIQTARPFDIVVSLDATSRADSAGAADDATGSDDAWTAGQLDRIADLDGVTDAEAVRGILPDAQMYADPAVPEDGTLTQLEAIDPAAWARASDGRMPETADGQVSVVEGTVDGDSVTVAASADATDAAMVALPVHTVKRSAFAALTTPATLAEVAEQLDRPIVTTQLIVRLTPDLDQGQVQQVVGQIAEGLGDSVVSPVQLEKQAYQQVIDVLLSIVTGLLAVAVVIAVLGVTNTLSLSVIERTRENALLRALGLTRGQLRGMLGVESVLVAVVATVLAIAIGTGCGLLGSAILFGQTLGGTAVSWTLPWGTYALFLAIAVVVGLAASLLPARRAARLSPVAGLQTE